MQKHEKWREEDLLVNQLIFHEEFNAKVYYNTRKKGERKAKYKYL